MNLYLVFYLLLTNLAGGAIFAYDKRAAIRHRRRIPERSLHLLELIGSAPVIIVLIYWIHHKNRKFSYYAITYLILAGWIGAWVWWYGN